jgi:cysteine desulfurase/selenocysteine lyase
MNLDAIRRDFPALQQEIYGKPLVYLDSAATALKPQAVIDAVTGIYARDCANIHRAVHLLSQRATESYEGARDKLQKFLGAEAREEIIFVRGTTEAINLVAQSYARPRLRPGDEILITGLEHHSNIVPWQQVCEQTGARLMVVPIDDRGEPTVASWAAKLSPRTKIVATAHISNALGTVQPIAELARMAHEVGAVIVVDGAQAAPHIAVDVRALGVDFYAISGHKLYGPSGAGVLWGRRALLDAMPPWQGGGDMIRSVTFEKTTYAPLPHKFEAGTPDIAAMVGLGAAVDYVSAIGFAALEAHEQDVLAYGTAALQAIPGLRLVGTAPHKAAVLSFTMEDIHPHDIGTIVDREGVAIRTGHHCAQPVMERYGLAATARASLGMYSSRADIDALVAALHQVRKVFA